MERLGCYAFRCVLGLALFCLVSMAQAQTDSYFRQDGGVAQPDDTTLPAELDEKSLAWKQEIPPGHSTPIVVGDRILLTAHEGPELITLCVSATNGQVLWRQAIRVEKLEKTHNEGSPAAASVASDGTRAFVFFGSLGLASYDLDGKPLWTRALGPFRDEFGAASSPIVQDGRVFLAEDHDLDSYLLAVKADSGETVWQTPREGFTRSYATPVLWQPKGGPAQLVVAGSLQLVGYDPTSGRQLWSRDGFARIVNTTPALSGETLFVATWSPGGDSDARIAMEPWDTALGQWDKNKNGLLENEEMPEGEVRSRFFRIDLDGDRALDQREWNKYAKIFELAQNTLTALRPDPAGGPPTLLWEYKRGLPYVSSPTVYRDQVILIKDGVVTVLNAADGKLVKQVRAAGQGSYYASPVAGDGKIYLASGAGVVSILSGGERPAVLSSHDFGERIAATPTIAEGRLYLRTDKALYCYRQPTAE